MPVRLCLCLCLYFAESECERVCCACSNDESFEWESAPLHFREARHRNGAGEWSWATRTLRAVVAQGEEVTYDYNFRVEDGSSPCFCRAPSCRGVLN